MFSIAAIQKKTSQQNMTLQELQQLFLQLWQSGEEFYLIHWKLEIKNLVHSTTVFILLLQVRL